MKEQEIIKEYINGKNIPQLAKIYSLGKTTIHRILIRNHIERRTISVAMRNPNIVHNYFNKYDKDTCYWAGFIAADGHISHTQRAYYVGIGLKINDIEHIEKLANKINYNKIRKNNKSCLLQFASKEMFMDLKNNFNIQERKSLILKPCNIPEKFTSHYVRGYFDGDGHILKDYDVIGFSGTYEMLRWIKTNIKLNCDVGNPNILKDKNIFSLRFQGISQVPKILSWIYKDSKDKLDRKYKIASKYGAF